MEVLVRMTKKNKYFHARVDHFGLETDVKLDWVIMTCYGSVKIAVESNHFRMTSLIRAVLVAYKV